MDREYTTKKRRASSAPVCKVCGESHWSYEGHKLGIIDAKAKVIEKITKPAIAAPVKRGRGRPKGSKNKA